MSAGKGAPLGAPNPNAIPEELRRLPQWVCWKYEQRDGQPKPTKVPKRPSGGNASKTTPSHWVSFDEALAASDRFDGIGVVLTADDPFCGIDLDDCFDEHGELHPGADRIIERLGSYTERSPSRRGLRVFIQASKNGQMRSRTNAVPWQGQIEIYDVWFFTVTGDQLEDSVDTIEPRQAELDALLAELLPADRTERTVPPTTSGSSERSDDEVLARAFAAKNGAKVRALFRGDRTGYESASEADQALVSALAFWTQDPAQLDRLFRRSGLMREKWERADYRDKTIATALESGKFFDWSKAPKPTRQLEELTSLTVAEILDAAGGGDGDGEEESGLKELMKLLGGKASVATMIVDLVEKSGAVLFHDPADETAYATIGVDGHTETHAMRSRAFKLWVRRLYFAESKSAPNSTALADALGVLEGQALFDGPGVTVHLRVAADDDAIAIDLGDDRWRAIRITARGWELLDYHPVRFRRSGGMAALPVPEQRGTIAKLRDFVNVDDDGFVLLVGALVAALRPNSPYPVTNLIGEQGSAKSTIAKVMRALVDPSSVPLHAPPHDKADLMVAATNSWCVALDNMSSIPQWLSDSLCRLSTGGGVSKRMLYTDGDEFLLDAMRPVVLTGIGELAESSDLLDRSLMVECPVIPKEERLTERDFWRMFAEQHAAILGALYDAVSHALAHVGDVRLERPPRMADFAVWATAAEQALGWKSDTFMSVYDTNRDEVHELAVEASPVGPPLLEVAGGGFEGTMGELLALLTDNVDEKVTKRKDWPRSPRGLRNHVKRLAPNLRALGLRVTFWRESTREKRRMVSIERKDA